ncbi:MAG: DUF1800 domain-containing protein [Panacagrimonas sp.]
MPIKPFTGRYSRAGLIIIFLALCPFAAQAIPAADAAHLLRRTGFEATPEQVQMLSAVDRTAAVDQLIQQARRDNPTTIAPPAWANEAIDDRFFPKGLQGQERKDYRRQMLGRRSVELQEWWIKEMVATPSPLRERMTLFWHGHLASEFRKVQWAQLMLKQNQLFRRLGLGNYRTLLQQISRDAAMLIYLDNHKNIASSPNENYARELLELFTLGEGHYTEQDVREVARAFSGWRSEPPDGHFVIDAKLHDAGDKQVLGSRGKFDGDDIIDILLKQPRAGEYIAERFWIGFVSPVPDPKAVQRLGAAFARDWELSGLLRAVLLEPAFWDAGNRGTLMKSPVEFVIGTVRTFKLPLDPSVVLLATDSMGQSVFNPPNVKGWPQGVDWVTSQTLLARTRFIEFVVGDAPDLSTQQRTSVAFANRTRVEARRTQKQIVEAIVSYADEDSVGRVEPLLLAVPPVRLQGEGLKPSERLESWLLDLSYNLK